MQVLDSYFDSTRTEPRREGALWSALFHVSVLIGAGWLAGAGVMKITDGSVRFLPPIDDAAILAVWPRAGGGGGADVLPPSRGRPPRFAAVPLASPSAKPRQALLEVEPTLLGPAEPQASTAFVALGDPLGSIGPPSNGTGGTSGIGRDGDGGIGGRGGSGIGPGERGLRGVFDVGGGVTRPRLIRRVEPDYSEEARKAKWEGVVVLVIVVAPDGKPRNIQVVQSLGMGLDEQAVEAVSQWRFDPGRRGGEPVPVRARVEVSFRLL